MCLGGDWEVQASYMHGTCVVQASPKPRELEGIPFGSVVFPQGSRQHHGISGGPRPDVDVIGLADIQSESHLSLAPPAAGFPDPSCSTLPAGRDSFAVGDFHG
jgi:hypothetical protein